MIAKLNKPTNIQAVLIIGVIGIATHIMGIGNPFDGGDDKAQIVANIPVHSISNIGIFFRGSTFYTGNGLAPLSGDYYRPLMLTVYSLLYTVFGPNPVPFHVVQQMLFISSAFLLFLIFRRCSFHPTAALFLALIFLVHPILSPIAFSIPDMQDALFMFFGLLAFWLLLERRSVRSLVLVSACLFLALLSKETAVLFVVVAVLYLFWWDRQRLYAFVSMMVLPIFIWITLRTAAVGLFVASAHLGPIDDVGLAGRMLTMPSILLLYLTNLVWPFHLASTYYWDHPTFGIQEVLLPLLIDAVVVAAVVYGGLSVRKRGSPTQRRAYWFFALWCTLGLVAYSQIVPLDQTANDLWFAFPMVGVLGMAGVLITSCAPTIHIDRRWIMAVSSLLVVLLGIGTLSQGALWGNPVEQHIQDVANSPDYHSYGNLAYDDAASGDCSQANVYALKSVALYPNALYLQVLGQSYAALGNYPAASKAYSESIQLMPYNQTYENWAALFTHYGTFSSGQQFFQEALGAYPNDGPLWFWLAYFLYLHNDTVGAKQAIAQAIALDPNNPTFGLISSRIASGLPLPAINLPCQ